MPSSDYLPLVMAAAEQVGVPAEQPEPIRIGDHAIYRLAPGIVARLCRPGHGEAATKSVAVARWLERVEVPAVGVLPVAQPVEVDVRAVTFWRELPPHKPATLDRLAAALRQLHQLPVPTDLELPILDPFAELDLRLNDAVLLPEAERAWLAAQLTALRERYAHDTSIQRSCVIHGDAHDGNIVTTDDGTTLMLDLERFAVGPPEWDLVSIATEYQTAGWHRPEDYAAFVNGYGQDVIQWSSYELFRDIREFRMTCYVAGLAGDHPEARDETTLRIRCLQGACGSRPWVWTAM